MVLDHKSYSGPIFGLFDFDPYGVEILRCYRAGSKVSQGDPRNSVPEMKWIGVKLRDVVTLASDALVLTSKDRESAVGMIEAMTFESGDAVPGLEGCRAQLQGMLLAGKKAEIQTIDNVFGLQSWLEDEMVMRVLEAGL